MTIKTSRLKIISLRLPEQVVEYYRSLPDYTATMRRILIDHFNKNTPR